MVEAAPPPKHELVENGLAAKAEGNGHFKAQEFKLAITAYTKAIDAFDDYVDMQSSGEDGGGEDHEMATTSSTPSTSADSTPTGSPDGGENSSTDKDQVMGGTSTGAGGTSSSSAAKSGAAGGGADGGSKDHGGSGAVDPALAQVRKDMAICHSNRAFCHIKMENFGSAIIDAEAGIEADRTYSKSYYRLGCAKYALAKYKEAQKAFKQLCTLAPQDKDARLKLKECDKMVQQQKFAMAIASDDTLSAAVTSLQNFEKMEIPESYSGPVYPSAPRSSQPPDSSGEVDKVSGKTTIFNVAEGLTREWVLELMDYMKKEKTIHKKCAYKMVLDMSELLKKVGTVERINEEEAKEFTICGDVHGQFYDLLNIWEINGYPSEQNPYLFNGDFVDRGSFSVECILALFAWKLLYPTKLHLARGNHETRNMNKLYGFEGEVRNKFDAGLYELFCEVFGMLPLCHVLNKEVFAVHGGLFSVDNVTLEDLDKENRLGEPPDQGGRIVEMLWSDPTGLPGRYPSRRGVGVNFGPDVTKNFLSTNDLSMVVRSHEMKDDGYEVEHAGKLVTIFSAPNYCDQMKNKGALLRYKLGEKDESWYADCTDAVKKSNAELRNMCFKVVQFESYETPGSFDRGCV